ncbi:MAG: ABC transporter ATP-binding protein [Candidatus Bathyarchaeia archaeon]
MLLRKGLCQTEYLTVLIFMLLRTQDLVKTFGGLNAVDHVSIEVDEGALIGIIGPNGSGKTTLFNLISGAIKPTSGKIYFKQERIDGLEPYEAFARGIVRSYQIPHLFYGMTVRENTLVPPRSQIGERILRAPFPTSWIDQETQLTKKSLDLLTFLQMNHLFGAIATDLSGGQSKLVEIGRAMMGEPSMLLLDEPTAGVTPNLATEIFENIASLRKRYNLTILIIEHKLEILFNYVQHAFVMDKGKIIYSGSPSEVSKDPKVVEAYFGY